MLSLLFCVIVTLEGSSYWKKDKISVICVVEINNMISRYIHMYLMRAVLSTDLFQIFALSGKAVHTFELWNSSIGIPVPIMSLVASQNSLKVISHVSLELWSHSCKMVHCMFNFAIFFSVIAFFMCSCTD